MKVYNWLKEHGIVVRNREGVPLTDGELLSYCLEYEKSIEEGARELLKSPEGME